jgi:hypothetical protein
MARDGLLHGWTLFTLLPVVLQAFGGIIVGLVMKHAGGVQKGFAIMGGILLSGSDTYISTLHFYLTQTRHSAACSSSCCLASR